MKNLAPLKTLLISSAVLISLIFLLDRGLNWPVGLEGLECLVSFIVVIVSIFLIKKFQIQLSDFLSQKNIIFGIYIGLLWTIEIGMNNIIQPRLPLRDNLDDIFWAIIACFIFCLAIKDSFETNKISKGIKAGFVSGFSSGAVACATALILIAFGMHLLLTDQVNIAEWKNLNNQNQYPNMAVYFAYQTMAGAMLHLVVLGAIMGLLLGIIGGLLGKLFSSFILKSN